MTWLINFSEAAAKTDRLVGNPNHTELLAAGLLGEVGGIIAEAKKRQRERNAYPAYHRKLVEEIGDFLWYYTRLISISDATLLEKLHLPHAAVERVPKETIFTFLKLGARVGAVISAISAKSNEKVGSLLLEVWSTLVELSNEIDVSLEAAAEDNLRKIESRFSTNPTYGSPFDENFPEEERLPRCLNVEFLERSFGEKKTIILRCNGLNIGDRITDNIEDPDYYRYHDIFHFAFAVHMGWSPVIRALLRCKRKSKPQIDEAEDGARAIILEEAVAATVFSRAKELNFFEGIEQVDYDLLKSISGFIEGYEVSRIPLWQWEAAILDGYRVFRLLRDNCGGCVNIDLLNHQLTYGEKVGN